jgi:hypothetical protein
VDSLPQQFADAPLIAIARPDPLYHGVWLALSSAALLLALVLSVRDGSQVLVPLVDVPLPELCMLRRTTGLCCPGCGLTRCFIAAAHGNLAAAWSYNPAGLFVFGLVALQIPFRSLQLWRLRRGLPELGTGLVTPIVLGLVAASLFVQWAVRLVQALL